VISGGQTTASVYLGKTQGEGFNTTPALTINLAAGAAPSAVLVTDLNADNKPDLVVANSALDKRQRLHEPGRELRRPSVRGGRELSPSATTRGHRRRAVHQERRVSWTSPS